MVGRDVVRLKIAGIVADHVRGRAARLPELAVHVDQLETRPRRHLPMGAIVQVIDVLGDQQEVAFPPRRQFGQGPVRSVGMHCRQLASPLVVEVLHQRRIPRERLGRRHILDPMTQPQTVRRPEGGHAGFRRDAGAGQDDEVARGHHYMNARRCGAASMGLDVAACI